MEESINIHRHVAIKGPLLDVYLEHGWYRYGSNIFTIDYFSEEEIIYNVHWIRYHTTAVLLNNQTQKLIKKNKHFAIQIRPFENNAEIENLHALYLEQIDFVSSPTIEALLDDPFVSVYDTQIIEIRDKETLIAAGIFDVGEKSIAGIKNFYDPAYKKFALGKYLMLLKLRFCIEKNIPWYYPGYIVPGNRRFDYKLFIDKAATEIFLPNENKWLEFNEVFKNYP